MKKRQRARAVLSTMAGIYLVLWVGTWIFMPAETHLQSVYQVLTGVFVAATLLASALDYDDV